MTHNLSDVRPQASSMNEGQKAPVRFATRLLMAICAIGTLLAVFNGYQNGDWWVAFAMVCLVGSAVPSAMVQLRNPELDSSQIPRSKTSNALLLAGAIALVIPVVIK
jgi:hypothetical protein